jgi:uncharacterized membrane protein YhaH (DUF805 family)
MSHIHRISHLARFLAAFTGALLGLAVSAPAAFALRVPAPGGSSSVSPAGPSPTFTHTVVASGMPGWQITVIVAVVALLAATIAIVVDRARAARRTGMVPAT